MMAMLESKSTAADIRMAGLRGTRSRMAVLELLRGAERPLTHSEVVDAFVDEPWDRATLYRNLVDMAEAGLLRRISLGSTWHFEASQSMQGQVKLHPHFVCDACGHVECTPEVQMQLKGSRKSSKAIQRGQIEIQLHGLCDACQ
ncbi:MAG: transcriptional repressor [Myxococcales bacterium]|nr:MAG: transcriptional repressor [Myxococcales bacterium]